MNDKEPEIIPASIDACLQALDEILNAPVPEEIKSLLKQTILEQKVMQNWSDDQWQAHQDRLLQQAGGMTD